MLESLSPLSLKYPCVLLIGSFCPSHLTEAEDIKKEDMERIHIRTVQKDLHNPDIHYGVITHLEPDTLECKVKC